jgi:serine/threonine protein kinase
MGPMVECTTCGSTCEEGHRFCARCGAEVVVPASQRSDPMVGRVLPGGYRVQHLAGVGGMGRVYLAEQTTLGRTVAVKVIHPHLAGDELAAGRFITEARASSRLHHPNSIAIYDFGRTDDGQLYLVMEYLRGKDLARVLHEEGPLPFSRIVGILRQTLDALEEAHDLSIIHRDLKPENILLEPVRAGGDFVKVLDFGLAKMRDAGPGAAVTSPGFVCGTPEYMSPEQGRGGGLDGRSDLYSLGVILFEMLTRALPFVGDSPTKILLAQISTPAPDPRAVNPERGIPAALAELTLRMLAKDPADRLPTARAFANALSAAVGENVDTASGSPSGAFCASCGATNPISQKFCGECGVSLSLAMPSERPTTPRAPRVSISQAPSSVPISNVHPTHVGARVSELQALIGREEAMAWLQAQREDARAMPSNARIVGESGVGKSRLLREFAARQEHAGDVVVEIAPHASGARPTARALVEAVKRLSGLGTPSRDDWAWDDSEGVDGLDDLFGVPSGGPRGPGERRTAYAAALRWAITRAAPRAPEGVVVLAVDDFEELDGVSRNAIADVMAEPPLERLLIVVACARDVLQREPGPGERFDLAPLTAETVAALGGLPAVPYTPLHVEQLLAWRRESSEAPPATVVELVARRVRRLSAGARAALRAFAITGGGPDQALLADLFGLAAPGGGDAGLASAVEELTTTRFVVGDHIAHPLFRQVALAETSSRLRRELHARAFEHFRSDAPLELRAFHARRGDLAFHGLVLLDELATIRSLAGDADGGIEALRNALELARRELARGELDEPLAAVVTFSRKLADALAASEAYADAEGVLREGVDIGEPRGAEKAEMLASLARIAHRRQRPSDAAGYLEQAIRVARQSDASELVASLETMRSDIA